MGTVVVVSGRVVVVVVDGVVVEVVVDGAVVAEGAVSATVVVIGNGAVAEVALSPPQADAHTAITPMTINRFICCTQ